MCQHQRITQHKGFMPPSGHSPKPSGGLGEGWASFMLETLSEILLKEVKYE